MRTEAQEQVELAAWLRARGWLFTATANGAATSQAQRVQQARGGLKRGVPDLLVFDGPKGYAGVAIELKRARGGTVRPEQARWLAELRQRGWLAIVARGAADAIRQIEEAEDECSDAGGQRGA